MGDEQTNDTAEERKGEGRRSERQRRVQVTVVRRVGLSALVEYAVAGRPRRVTIPAEKVEAGKAEADELEAGLPYGLPWEKLEVKAPTGADIAVALRNAGIWTADDLHKMPQRALAALQSVYRLDLAKLNQFAADASKESGK